MHIVRTEKIAVDFRMIVIQYAPMHIHHPPAPFLHLFSLSENHFGRPKSFRIPHPLLAMRRLCKSDENFNLCDEIGTDSVEVDGFASSIPNRFPCTTALCIWRFFICKIKNSSQIGREWVWLCEIESEQTARSFNKNNNKIGTIKMENFQWFPCSHLIIRRAHYAQNKSLRCGYRCCCVSFCFSFGDSAALSS